VIDWAQVIKKKVIFMTANSLFMRTQYDTGMTGMLLMFLGHVRKPSILYVIFQLKLI
jgi:hypothetical protein